MKLINWNIVLAGLVLAGAAALMTPALAYQAPPPLSARIAETAPVPAAKIPAYIKSAVDAPDRSAADKELDAGRKPEQVLDFFGIKPGMKVADLSAGAGYTTEILARTVGPTGKVYSQNGPFPERFKKAEEAWHARLKNLKNVVEVDKPFDAPDLLPVPPGSLDAVIINMSYHDLVGHKADRDTMNAEVMQALKPGGEYCVIDNSAQEGSGARDTTTLHRIDEHFVIKEVEKAGFKLAAASSALRNPNDDRTWFIFKHRGEQDRFMLKFVKPE
jgi:predicted methyltransferase